jgi:hypothetical protein
VPPFGHREDHRDHLAEADLRDHPLSALRWVRRDERGGSAWIETARHRYQRLARRFEADVGSRRPKG